MVASNMSRYCDLMEEIKRRVQVIEFLFDPKTGSALYLASTLESIALQLRKVLELVAFGSLLANKDRYSAAYADFASHWKAKELLRLMEKVNPGFYPKPVIENPGNKPGVKVDLAPVPTDEYLTRDEFVKVYDKCGALLHAENPFGAQRDYDFYAKNLHRWYSKTTKLLDVHTISLYGETGFHLVQMHGEGGIARAYGFELAPPGVVKP